MLWYQQLQNCYEKNNNISETARHVAHVKFSQQYEGDKKINKIHLFEELLKNIKIQSKLILPNVRVINHNVYQLKLNQLFLIILLSELKRFLMYLLILIIISIYKIKIFFKNNI